jgi:hypothetical protein
VDDINHKEEQKGDEEEKRLDISLLFVQYKDQEGLDRTIVFEFDSKLDYCHYKSIGTTTYNQLANLEGEIGIMCKMNKRFRWRLEGREDYIIDEIMYVITNK